MELRILRYFLTVAREESISRAAEALHITQPTLSRQLMELESELGKQLLIRGNRKVALTEAGVLLRKRASELVALADKAEAELRADDEIIAGDIYIGAGESDAMRLVIQAAQQLRDECPHIRYHLYSGNADDVAERLDKGLLDFGVMIEPFDLQKYEHLPLPAADTWGVLMRRDNPLAARASIRAEDLWGQPLITSRQAMVKGNLTDWFRKDFSTQNIVATHNLVYNAARMAEAGMGYLITLDKLVYTGDDSPLCFRPLEPELKSGLGVVWKKHQVFSKAAGAFLARLRKQFSAE